MERMNTTGQIEGSARDGGDWISLAEASRILGTCVGSTKSMALSGAIRVQARPGLRVVYSRADCLRWAGRYAETVRALEGV
jgi:hypothetical protein